MTDLDELDKTKEQAKEEYNRFLEENREWVQDNVDMLAKHNARFQILLQTAMAYRLKKEISDA